MDTFEKDVLDYIKRHGMLDGARHCVCGVSGGADSVSMLTVLARHRDSLGVDIHVVHINHMIRGAEADGDQSFVEELCRSLGVDCVSKRIDVLALAKEKQLTVEEAGRIARYDAFAELCSLYEPEGCVTAVAHNRNDVAETVLFNMARGTGMAGIKGIAPSGRGIIRPLMGSDRRQIEEYLVRNGMSWRTDATNNEDDYARNKIRHKVLPVLAEINGQAVEHICALADMASEYDSLAGGLADDFLAVQGIKRTDDACTWEGGRGAGTRCRVDMASLKELSPLVRELVIRKLTGMACGGLKDIGRSHVAEVEKLLSAKSGAGIDLPHGARAYVEYEGLVFAPETEPPAASGRRSACDIDMTSGGVYEIPQGRLTVRFFDRCGALDLSKKECTKLIDYDKIKQCLQLRTYEPGDYMVIAASGARKKLNRLFTDSKIPPSDRQGVCLVASGQEIVWAVGMRIGENYKVTDGTVRVAELTFEKTE